MALREKLISADEFWELSHAAGDELRRDLIEGVICEMSPAGGAHGVIALKFGARILEYVEAHQLGWVTAAETGYVIQRNPGGKDTVLAPDVGYVSAGRLPQQPSPRYVPVAPDLAVEVVSPSDEYSEVVRKIRLYLAHGTRAVWIVEPKYQTVEIHTSDGQRTLEANDTLDGGAVLPGFTLALRDVFPAS